MYHASKYQGFQKLKPRCVLIITYISKSKETFKLSLNIWIFLSSNKIQLLQKQQFVNDFVRNLPETTEFQFLYLTSSLKKYGKYVLLAAATRGVLLEKVFLKIWQNSQENTCARDSFSIKLQARPLSIPH